ncbi:hypothetical protein NX801_00990 [Streptomyces sp. LP05-1]|uniref:Uncharacterized protein n=1 Tax=Streptomyces pyxinae TaxID=2970734 RepID=A0ABT2CA32_9ACTN|nr:hypothetical protein [Streptomyces sp. LP05-1]MCS0634263.1 hypothetical protein [Streptomyces sp. LP05-1]
MKNIGFQTSISTDCRTMRAVVIAAVVGAIAIADVQSASPSTAVASATVATAEYPLNDHGWD